MKRKMIDPPEGWLHGFPKEIPEHVDNTLKWLVENGYPQSKIDIYGKNFFVRGWYEEDKKMKPVTEKQHDLLINALEKSSQKVKTAPKELSDEEIEELYYSIARLSGQGDFKYIQFARAILKKASER